MKKVIVKYRKLIWIWSIVNLFALFVNYFNIEGSDSKHNQFLFTYTETYKHDGLWPFVKFIEFHDQFGTYGTHENDYTSFNGIFYQYDISEFLLYMGILIAFLVYKAYITTPIQIKVPDDPS